MHVVAFNILLMSLFLRSALLSGWRVHMWYQPHHSSSCWHSLYCWQLLQCRVESADVVSITALFFLLVLMAATQDIAVDGWALTLLARNNVG